jgi:hypothetical protein
MTGVRTRTSDRPDASNAATSSGFAGLDGYEGIETMDRRGDTMTAKRKQAGGAPLARKRTPTAAAAAARARDARAGQRRGRETGGEPSPEVAVAGRW